jgi:arsenate reductase-like glutaredoxin family protein
MEIKLYGAERCHKTQHYISLLNDSGIDHTFLDVEKSENNAMELRGLYSNNALNFPTLTIGDIKLRNPSDKELNKWLNKKL